MKLNSLKSPKGMKHSRKRVGRGEGSGTGTTAGRGMNGYHSRSGSKRRPWFEGGQMPLQRRIPKRGFTNHRFKNIVQIVNLDRLSALNIKEIDINAMQENGLIKSDSIRVKVLGNGDVEAAISISANAFSKSAVEKIEKAGGKAIIT